MNKQIGFHEITPLMIASYSGNIELVKILLSLGVKINMKTKYGRTAFYWSLSKNSYERINVKIIDHENKERIADLLVDAGANTILEDMFKAFELDEFDVLFYPLKYDIDINTIYWDKTLLMEAVDKYNFYQKGPNTILNSEESQEFSQKLEKYTLYIENLLNKGANINKKNESGYTVLHKTCGIDHYSDKTLKFLLKKGANINHKDELHGRTLLHYYCENEYIENDERVKRIKLLIEHGASINIKDSFGKYPFHYACTEARYGRKVNIDIMRIFVENGADVNCKVDGEKQNGRTPLMILCNDFSPDVKCVNYLIEKGAKADIKDENGRTAFDYLGNCKYDKQKQCRDILEKALK